MVSTDGGFEPSEYLYWCSHCLDFAAKTQGPWSVTLFLGFDEEGSAAEVFIEKASQYERVNAAVLNMIRRSHADKQHGRAFGRVTVNFVGTPLEAPAAPVEESPE